MGVPGEDAVETEGRPRWWADEMLGRLARYLRFVGHDVAYARGLADEEIARRATDEGRTLLTRDRRLAERTPGAILLSSPWIGGQLREVRAARPSARFVLALDRCPECNDLLRPLAGPPEGSAPVGPYGERPRHGTPVVACPRCGRWYWSGDHAEMITRHLAAWLQGSADR